MVRRMRNGRIPVTEKRDEATNDQHCLRTLKTTIILANNGAINTFANNVRIPDRRNRKSYVNFCRCFVFQLPAVCVRITAH